MVFCDTPRVLHSVLDCIIIILRRQCTRGNDRTHLATEIEQGGNSNLTALTDDGDYVLNSESCSERDFDDHGCSKANELFLVVIDGWAGRSELIAWTTFFCSLTERAHFQLSNSSRSELIILETCRA